MREYTYHATDTSIEALRCLKAPWSQLRVGSHHVVVTTADEEVIRLSVERAEVEPSLEARRIRADRAARADDATADDLTAVAGDERPVGDLAIGRNDIVLFTGDTWTEDAPPDALALIVDGNGNGNGNGAARAAPPELEARQTMQFSGRAGQRPPTATAVCTTTDAVVAAAATGEGILIRIGIRPSTLEVVSDRVAIARFLVQRGYATD